MPRQETPGQEAPGQVAIAPLSQRLLWFLVLWLGGVGTLALIAFGLRLWLAPK